MAASHLARHQIIQRLTEENRDKVIALWEPLAIEIISIIGEEGFNSLYERSERLTQGTFSWLATSQTAQTDQWLLKLRSCLESQPSSESYKANLLLLNMFTDTLAFLIGEQLTLRILNSTWDIDSLTVSDMEFKDEQ